MAEGWLTELAKIDREEPSPGLLERAERGPRRSDPASLQLTRMRVVIVAALVAITGAWVAFAGLGGIDKVQRQPPADGQEEFTALWPETSLNRAQDVQERVDAGDSDVQWRMDAGSVALRYAEDVLGWPSPIAGISLTDDPDKVLVMVSGPDASCSGADCQEVVQTNVNLTLQRLVRSGEGGVWSVTAAP